MFTNSLAKKEGLFNVRTNDSFQTEIMNPSKKPIKQSQNETKNTKTKSLGASSLKIKSEHQNLSREKEKERERKTRKKNQKFRRAS